MERHLSTGHLRHRVLDQLFRRAKPTRPVAVAIAAAGRPTVWVDGVGTDEIQRRLGVSKPTIRRWRTRYVEAGMDGLCSDRTRPPGKPPLGAAVIIRVIEKTLTEAPPDATH